MVCVHHSLVEGTGLHFSVPTPMQGPSPGGEASALWAVDNRCATFLLPELQSLSVASVAEESEGGDKDGDGGDDWTVVDTASHSTRGRGGSGSGGGVHMGAVVDSVGSGEGGGRGVRAGSVDQLEGSPIHRPAPKGKGRARGGQDREAEEEEEAGAKGEEEARGHEEGDEETDTPRVGSLSLAMFVEGVVQPSTPGDARPMSRTSQVPQRWGGDGG